MKKDSTQLRNCLTDGKAFSSAQLCNLDHLLGFEFSSHTFRMCQQEGLEFVSSLGNVVVRKLRARFF